MAVIFVVGAMGAGCFYFFKSKPKLEEKAPIAVEKNYFEINDETVGVYFQVGKNFERMMAQELQAKNPTFLYGFSAKSDKSVYCVIAQTKRDKPGLMKAMDLRDGVLEQVKKSYPDAKLDSAEITDVGENDNKGVKLAIDYTDNKILMFQQEVVGITDKTATFAFCVAPKAVVDLYKDDFNLFLESVKIK